MTLVFLDTETTGLDRRRHHVWDIGLVVRKPDQPDVEYSWLVRPPLSKADPYGLRLGRFYERMADRARHFEGSCWRVEHPEGPTARAHGVSAADVAGEVAALADGATIVGAVPDFDDAMLGRFLRDNGHAPTWHYHLVDVETLAAGARKLSPPWDFDSVLALYGLKYDEADRHTALGDARMARDLYDAVMTEG